MQLPIFSPLNDPGPSFAELLHSMGAKGVVPAGQPSIPHSAVSHGTIPHGTIPHGTIPHGTIPHGTIPHGTTVLALLSRDGVVLAGDRQATMGYQIGSRSIVKVFPAGDDSGIAIAGAAGQAVELVRFFQLSISHYEKLEGTSLSLDGKANMLAQLVRGNFAQAVANGLFVVPIFAGFDELTQSGRIFEYDVTGGRYEEHDFVLAGSGATHARTALKLSYDSKQSLGDAKQLALSALFWASDEDVATGGPDLLRGIYPTIATITRDGFQNVPDTEIEDMFARFLSERSRPADKTERKLASKTPSKPASKAPKPEPGTKTTRKSTGTTARKPTINKPLKSVSKNPPPGEARQ